jgi:hypothetical protein
MPTNEQLACRQGAGLFCMSDFRHRQGNLARRCGRATSEQKGKSNSVWEGPLSFQQDIGSQLDEDIFSSSEALLPALCACAGCCGDRLHRSDHRRDGDGHGVGREGHS